MRAVETTARHLARAARGALDMDWSGEKLEEFVEIHWCEYESDARRLLRALKGQPPHVIDAPGSCIVVAAGSLSAALDSMLEAMAR